MLSCNLLMGIHAFNAAGRHNSADKKLIIGCGKARKKCSYKKFVFSIVGRYFA